MNKDERQKLLGLLWFAWSEFNAIRAHSGAPLQRDGMTSCTGIYWSSLTDAFAEAIGPDALTPWPSQEAKTVKLELPHE